MISRKLTTVSFQNNHINRFQRNDICITVNITQCILPKTYIVLRLKDACRAYSAAESALQTDSGKDKTLFTRLIMLHATWNNFGFVC